MRIHGRWISTLALFALVISTPGAPQNASSPHGAKAAKGASAPAPESAVGEPKADANAKLPVRRVVLYKSGVGYFEHQGHVHGNQTVRIDFSSGQLNDVLQSLTVLDLNGGRIGGVTYNSEAPLNQRLGTLRLPLNEETDVSKFYEALRGARLEIRSGTGVITGRLLSVESKTRVSGTTTQEVNLATLVSDSGEVRSVELTPAVSVRLAEGDVNQEVGRYLSLLASVRQEDLRRMTIATAGTGDRQLYVSYISEVPIWKTTYRIVLPSKPGDETLLQGWAIVDNTVGEDWDNVELSLVAGAPQSFIEKLSQPYYSRRPVISLPQNVQLAPQTHEGAMLEGGKTDAGEDKVVDRQYVENLPLNGRSAQSLLKLTPGVVSGSGIGGGVGAGKFSVNGQRAEANGFTVDGVSLPPPPEGVAGWMELSDAQRKMESAATGAALGDLFEYKLKDRVTIRKNESALVPIVQTNVTAEKVSLWNTSLHSPRPLRALWLMNASALTLDGGSFSILDNESFAGEGLTDSIKPGEKRLVSYASDLGVRVDEKTENTPQRITRVRINRGVMIQTRELRHNTTYTIRDDDTTPRSLLIEHPLRSGWKLADDAPKPDETTSNIYRFRVSLTPKDTTTLVINEAQPQETQYQLTNLTGDQIQLFVRQKSINPEIEAALRKIIEQKNNVAALEAEVSRRDDEKDKIDDDQDRIRENMKALKGTPEERALTQRYTQQLADQETRLQTLQHETADFQSKRDAAQAELDHMIQNLSLEASL